MNLDRDTILNAILKASRGHSRKREVKKMLSSIDEWIDDVGSSVLSRSYLSRLSYREFDILNDKGKKRHIEQPSLFTRVLQHLFILQIQPLYDSLDPKISYNCKTGYGIHAKDKRKSMAHRIKHAVYDRRDLKWAIKIDQRLCYQHISRKTLRRALKLLTRDRELIDFGVEICFNRSSFPIGTPTSPIAHHIIMLDFDRWLGSIPGPKFRYADDLLLMTKTKRDANRAKWRIKQFWWSKYGMRAKRRHDQISSLDSEPLSFCGEIYRRLPSGGVCSHGKGYSRPRRNIVDRAKRCRRDQSWASYFGMLSKTDSYKTMIGIEVRMNLKSLTEKIKIDRAFDAEPISIQELSKRKFTLFDFEVRESSKKDGSAWARMLVGVEERERKWRRYCVKTEAEGVVLFLSKMKSLIEAGESVLPLTDCELENAMGYIFRGSTDREMYISRDNCTLPNGVISELSAKKLDSAS